jgi:hypothetical protein
MNNAFATVFPTAIPVIALEPTGDKATKRPNGGFILPVILTLANGIKTPWRVYAGKKKEIPGNLARDTHTIAAGRFAVELDFNNNVRATVSR